jgi:hypothetical protein
MVGNFCRGDAEACFRLQQDYTLEPIPILQMLLDDPSFALDCCSRDEVIQAVSQALNNRLNPTDNHV